MREGRRLPAKFNSHVHELHVLDGILFRGDRVIISVAMRAEILECIHEGHLKDITEMARKCDICMTYQYKQPSQSLAHGIQDFSWHKVGTDIFTLGKKDYLIVIDYFSKSVILALKSVFSRPGIPVEINQ